MVPQVPDALIGAAFKIQWAYKNLHELERRAFTISRGNSDFIGKKEDAQSGYRVYYLHRDPIIPPDFILQAGSVLQSLRASLDHVAWALCIAGPGGLPAAEAKIKRIHFPINKGDANAYRGDEARREVIRLSKPGVEQVLDRIEPYKGGAGSILVPLKLLNDLDKHRLLFGAVLNQPMRDHSGSKEFDPVLAAQMRAARILSLGLGMWPAAGDPLKAGDQVYREPLDREPDENADFAFTVAFKEPEILPVEPIVDTLHYMADFVNRLFPVFFPFV